MEYNDLYGLDFDDLDHTCIFKVLLALRNFLLRKYFMSLWVECNQTCIWI